MGVRRWLPVPGHGDRYQVNAAGRVRSIERMVSCRRPGGHGRYRRPIPAKVLTPLRGSNGYLFVHLANGCGAKTFLLHRIVAEAFLGPGGEGCEVNHRDLDKTNNHVSNLEWVTPSENMRHYYERRKHNAKSPR